MKDYFSMLCAWYLNRNSKKQNDEKKKLQDEKLKEVYNRLKQLESFIKFLNEKAFTNRHERKAFWRNVIDGQPVLEDTLKKVLSRYGVKDETIAELDKRKKEKIEAIKVAQHRAELERRMPSKPVIEKAPECKDCTGDCSKCVNRPQPSELKQKEDETKKES